MEQTYESDLAQAGPAIQLAEYTVLPTIDHNSMSARFRICTARPDREGEIIEPSGVDWEDYANTGVVKFEHGFTGVPFPVAKSIDSNGMLHLEYDFDEDAIYARAFHSEKDELSAQMFGLIDEGFIRASSIHVIPIHETALGPAVDGRKAPSHALTSHMLEWSECTVGVNPDAYAKALTGESKISEVLNLQLEASERILAKGLIGGRKILPSLAKCLTANRPTSSVTSPGENFTQGKGDMPQSKTKEQVDALTPLALMKCIASPADYDADTLKHMRFRAKALDEDTLAKMYGDDDTTAKSDDPDAQTVGDSVDTDTETLAEADEPPPSRPLGAEVLAAAHGKLKEFVSHCEEALKAVENDQVIAVLTATCDAAREEVATIEGAYSTVYADLPGLASEEVQASEEMVKAWVAGSAKASFQLDGLAHRLETTLGKVTDSKAKSVLSSTVRDLRLLNSKAKSYQPPAGDESALKQRVEKLEALVDKTIDLLAKRPAQV